LESKCAGGVEVAVEAINAAGGVRGQRLAIVLGDDASDPRQGVSVANKFAAEQVRYVVGHFNSGVSIPASEVYAENGILQMSPASTNPRFTDRGLWNVFRSCGRDDQQAAVAAKHVLKNLRDKRVAIVHDKSTAGRSFADFVKGDLNRGGLQETLNETVSVGDKDMSALVSKLKNARAEVIIYGGGHTEAALLIRQMKDQGVGAVLIGADALKTSELSAIAGAAVEGTLMTFGPDPRKNPTAIGRALISRPRLLLLDEPSLGLAPLISKQIFDAIRRLNVSSGLTVLMVEQNAHQALRLSAVLRYSLSRPVQVGGPCVQQEPISVSTRFRTKCPAPSEICSSQPLNRRSTMSIRRWP
jgi:hypothetical protein